MSDYELRLARPDDFDQLVALSLASADTGRVAVAPKYVRNPVEAAAALKPELEWVVAEAEEGLIGSGQVVLSQAEVEGELYPSAILTTLMVHPAQRRRGIAKALTRWRLDRAGPDAVVAAAIQTGNEGSFANARGWATQIFGELMLPIIGVLSKPPKLRGIEIREPEGEEWESAAEGLAAFEQGWNLRIPETGPSLRERVERALPGGERPAHYFVAVSGGRVVGGFELFEGALLQTFVVERMPLEFRLLNLALRFVPPGGEVRQNSVTRFWYEEPGVGRALWAFARFRASATGTGVGMQFDPRGPLAEIERVKPWIPKGKLAVAVRSPVELSEETLLSPP